MSKQLIKILVICALVIICPLVIVGVALMSTEAVGCVLTVAYIGEDSEVDFGGKTNVISMIVDGKEKVILEGTNKKEAKITLTKKTEVTITYEGVGYNYVGWYKGTASEVSEEAHEQVNKEGEASYTFEINKNTALTVVRNIKKYNVSYSGKYDDNTTEINETAKTYYYNEPLATPQAKSSKYTLAGWHEYDQVEDIKGSTTKYANFTTSGDDPIVLQPTWERQYNFEFYGVADYNYNGNDGTFALKGTIDGKADQFVEELGTMMYFMENPTEGYTDSNQNVCDYFINQYSNIKTMNGENVAFANEIKIYYKVNESYSNLAKTVYLEELSDGVLSFADVLEYVRTAQGSLDNVLVIDVTFVYDLV